MNLETIDAAGAANGTSLAHAAADNPVRIRIEDIMVDEDKEAKTAAEKKDADTAAEEKTAEKSKAKEKDAPTEGAAEDAPAKKKTGISPLVLILSAVGSLVVFVAVFSYTMGVFDPPPPESPEAGEVATTESAPAGETDYAVPQGYHSEFGRAAAEVAASQDSGAVDTIAQLSQLDQHLQELAAEETRIGEERRELAQLRQEVESLLARQEAIADEKILYMAKLLDGMKPDEMTGLVLELDNKMILRVLPKMKPQNASKLLAQLPPKRAAAITTALLDSEF